MFPYLPLPEPVTFKPLIGYETREVELMYFYLTGNKTIDEENFNICKAHNEAVLANRVKAEA